MVKRFRTVFHVTLEVLVKDTLDFYFKWHPSPIALHNHCTGLIIKLKCIFRLYLPIYAYGILVNITLKKNYNCNIMNILNYIYVITIYNQWKKKFFFVLQPIIKPIKYFISIKLINILL